MFQYRKSLVPVLATLSASAKRYNCGVLIIESGYCRIAGRLGECGVVEANGPPRNRVVN